MFQARPVFISSTFVDMQAERDHLRLLVFPELEERLRARRGFLEWVDLRVGVATASQPDEETRELHVLKVCLDEVKRCRPFLIVLLGDRYGWVPPEHRIITAAEEAQKGFSANVVGRSVTDLEIDFGVLANPDQQTRSFFYFRDPLPYGDMPPAMAALYADSSCADAAAPDRVARLATLKNRIKTQLPDRVRSYNAGWDAERQCVAGLEQWGRAVLDDVWSEIEAELGPVAAATPSWQHLEADARDDFFQDRARDFVGRKGLCARLLDFAAGPPPPDESLVGICVTGNPGSGKSALFGELVRRLNDMPVVLLSHAAGASPQAVSLESMLRRWIGDLATQLGIDPGLPTDADPEKIVAAFTSLLHQTCERIRVVLLIDALDQLEGTTLAQYVTWLPKPWPDNARLLVSTIAGTASEALAMRGGITDVPLPPLDAGEAAAIVDAICARYHRQFESEVIQALLETPASDGFAWQNPLWLVLAVEELNLLDADDFARAQQTYTGEPAERLRALMIEIIKAFPPDVPGLYKRTFMRADEQFGIELSRDFLDLIAVSRGGWRESDFRIMLPLISKLPWDELRFAQLRRLYRGQIQKRGSFERWNFNHAQMRAAALVQLEASGLGDIDLHNTIVDCLLSCPTDDPLRISETMVHLLGSQDWPRAAAYYGSTSLTDAEVGGATRVLADRLIAASEDNQSKTLEELAKMLAGANSGGVARGDVAQRLSFSLSPAIDDRVSSAVRLAVEELSCEAFEAEAALNPDNPRWQESLALCLNSIGTILKGHGRLDEALAKFQSSANVMEKLLAAGGSIGNAYISFIAGSQRHIADVLLDLGRVQDALKIYRQVHAVDLRIATENPAMAIVQHRLSSTESRLGTAFVRSGQLNEALVSYRSSLRILERIASESPNYSDSQSPMATLHDQIGTVLRTQGRLKEAIGSFSASHLIRERLAVADPANSRLQRDLGISLTSIADAFLDQGALDDALINFRKTLTIFERLEAADPFNLVRQEDIIICLVNIGNALKAKGDLEEALVNFKAGASVSERMLAAHPSSLRGLDNQCTCLMRVGEVLYAQNRFEDALRNFQAGLEMVRLRIAANPTDARYKNDLRSCHMKIGDALRAQNNVGEALDYYRAGAAIAQELVEADPTNASWQRGLAGAHGTIGLTLEIQGNLQEALTRLRISHAIAKRFSVANPANVDFRDLSLASYRDSLELAKRITDGNAENTDREIQAVSYETVGDIHFEQGEMDQAAWSYLDALKVRESFAKGGLTGGENQNLMTLNQKIGEALLQRDRSGDALVFLRMAAAIGRDIEAAGGATSDLSLDLSLLDDKIGDILLQQGDLPAAEKSLLRAWAIREQLVKDLPYDAVRQRNLATSLEKMSDVKLAQGDLLGARAYARKGVAVAQGQKEALRNDTDWKRREAVFWMRLGEVHGQERDPESALVAFENAINIRMNIAEIETSNVGWRRDLAISYAKIGDAQKMLGDFVGALDSYLKSNDSFGQLVDLDPANANWKRDLSTSCEKVGTAKMLTGDPAGAMKFFHQCHKIISGLILLSPDNVVWQDDLARSYIKLVIGYGATKQISEAVKTASIGRELLENLLTTIPDHAVWWKSQLASLDGLIAELGQT